MVTNPLDMIPNSMDEIRPRLYLGDKNAACDLDLIAHAKLTHVVTAEIVPLPRFESHLT